jgi:hypothetical protein
MPRAMMESFCEGWIVDFYAWDWESEREELKKKNRILSRGPFWFLFMFPCGPETFPCQKQ